MWIKLPESLFNLTLCVPNRMKTSKDLHCVKVKFQRPYVLYVSNDTIIYVVKFEKYNPAAFVIHTILQQLHSPLIPDKRNTIDTIDINGSKYTMMLLNKANKSIMYLNKKEPDIQLCKTIIIDILEQLKYIHSSGYAHGDIKLDNILQYGDKFTLCDFEESAEIFTRTELDGDMEMFRYYIYIGSIDKENIGLSCKGDLYSLLIIMIQMYNPYNFCDFNVEFDTLHEYVEGLCKLRETLIQKFSTIPLIKNFYKKIRKLSWTEKTNEKLYDELIKDISDYAGTYIASEVSS